MPLNPEAKLVDNVFDLKAIDQKPTRDGFGKGVVGGVRAATVYMVLN